MSLKKETIDTYNRSAINLAKKFDEQGARIEDIKYVFSLYNKLNPAVLEIGCGNGDFLMKIKEIKNAKTTGLELNPAAFQIAKSKKLNVILDDTNNTIIVNGEQYGVQPPEANETPGVTMVTKPYGTKEYGQVYITLASKKGVQGHMIISQVGVKDHAVKSQVDLTCAPSA